MSVSKHLACYHEAGHAVRAYYLNRQSLVNGLIQIEAIDGGRWTGNAHIDIAVIEQRYHPYIALAGLMAEARLNGTEHPAAVGRNAVLAEDPGDLPDRLSEYYDLDDTPQNQLVLEGTPVNLELPTGQVFSVPAAISFADLGQIPVPLRTENAIGRALARLTDFFNHDDHWLRVWLLADELEQWDWNSPDVFDYGHFCTATKLQW
jgi:hypothetical protein